MVPSKIAADGCTTTLWVGWLAPRWLSVSAWVVYGPGEGLGPVMDPMRIATPAKDSRSPAMRRSRPVPATGWAGAADRTWRSPRWAGPLGSYVMDGSFAGCLRVGCSV